MAKLNLFLTLNSHRPTLCPKVVHTHIRAAHAPFALEAQPAVQDAPIVKDDRFARAEFHSQQELWGLEDTGPDSGGGVPFLQGGVVGERRRGRRVPVQVVPADLHESARRRRGRGWGWARVDEHRVPLQRGRRVEETPRGAAQRRRHDRVRRQRRVVFREVRVEVRCGGEAVYECRLATPAGLGRVRGRGVREQVEQLQAGRVGEVCRVCVRGQRIVCVRCVDRVDFRSEIPEAAVVRGSDVGDAFEDGFRRFGVRRGRGDEAEAVGVDVGEELGQPARRSHYSIVGDARQA